VFLHSRPAYTDDLIALPWPARSLPEQSLAGERMQEEELIS